LNHNKEKVTEIEQGGTRKRARTNVADDDINGAADVAFDLYRTYLSALDENDSAAQEEVFQKLVQVIETSSIQPFQESLSSIQTPTADMIGILVSIVYYQMASTAIEEYLHGDKTQQPHVFITKSLEYYPFNAACRSLAANFWRITNELPRETVTSWYQQAARDAKQVRQTTLELLESDHVHDSAKEWMELLLLQQVVDVEYNEDDDENDNGSFSASTVEGTARFMAAILLSRDGHHDVALKHLQSFSLTHRLHPNVWTGQDDTLARSMIATTTLTPPVSFHGVLPPKLYEKMCNTFAPDALFWKESDYDNMGYYSFLVDIDEGTTVKNLIDHVVLDHLLPLVQEVLGEKANAICAYEWWAHSRHASLGHALHFDTDKATIDNGETVHHPILSSVLHLTGDATATSGATIVLDQAPNSRSAQVCWRSVPQQNTFMVFPGDLLHGVLPCPGSDKRGETCNNRRLTFMVGFKTRSVPDQRRGKALYGPCAPLPPDTEAWVKEIQSGYEDQHAGKMEVRVAGIEMKELPCVTPAWEEIATSDDEGSDPPLELPQSIDQRFFIKGEPAEYFRQSLFEHDDVP
jgi:hypothetical protein